MSTGRALLLVAVLILLVAVVIGWNQPQQEEAGRSISSTSSASAETSLAFHQLKRELKEAESGAHTPAQIASWKARGELLALEVSAMQLETLSAIYRRLLGLKFSDDKLKARLEGALFRLERLIKSSAKRGPGDLNKVIEKLAQAGPSAEERESLLGELEAFEVYFYRAYKQAPKRNLPALFFAGKAAHARYFQGVDYLERYLAECEKPRTKCAHVEEARSLRGAHKDLIDKFEQ